MNSLFSKNISWNFYVQESIYQNNKKHFFLGKVRGWMKCAEMRWAPEDSKELHFATSYFSHDVSSRRQNNDYSPHAVKQPRLDSTSQPFVTPPYIRVPLPDQPERVVAGSSRPDYDRYYSRSYSHPPPPAGGTSSHTYAKDKVLWIRNVSSWLFQFLGAPLLTHKLKWRVSVHLPLVLAEWSN